MPSAIHPTQNKTIIEGGNVILSCNVSGTPPPMVSWIKVGGHMRTDSSELVFTNINRSAAGEYRCEASNQCGNASETARIFVQCELTITCTCNLPAMIMENTINVQIDFFLF